MLKYRLPFLTMFYQRCFRIVFLCLCLNIMKGTLCQAEDDEDVSRCIDKYVFYQGAAPIWRRLEISPCTITTATRSAKASVQNLPSNSKCTDLNNACSQLKRNLILLHTDDDTKLPFMTINISQLFGNQSYRLVYFEDDSCTEIIYTQADTPGKETLQSSSITTLLICQNNTQDNDDDPGIKRQTDDPIRKISTITPVYKSQKDGFGSDNSTTEINNFPRSAVLMYVAYALTGVAIFSAILTLSVCCISHHKRRKHTLDNGNYDAEYNLTVEQDAPHPQEIEVNDHAGPEPSVPTKGKLEFNNAIYNPSGLITKVIIQSDVKQDSNSSSNCSGPSHVVKNAPVSQQNGDCHKTAAQQNLSKSNKDIDKIGTSTFPSGEYQDFAVELKSKVRRVLSNPTYIHGDGVIRSPIHVKPVIVKSISTDGAKFNGTTSVAVEPKKDSPTKTKHKELPGISQSDCSPAINRKETRAQNSPEDKRLFDVQYNGDKLPAIQPRDMSYMYVQLPKDWSQNIPIEEPTVPYASTDVTKTIFKQVSLTSKHRPNGRGLTDDDGVYETYDRRT